MSPTAPDIMDWSAAEEEKREVRSTLSTLKTMDNWAVADWEEVLPEWAMDLLRQAWADEMERTHRK